METQDLCPCGTGEPYKECCQRYHRGQTAPTPGVLMRSRYTAYALGDVDYIMRTIHPRSTFWQANRAVWRRGLANYCETTRFLGLKVLEESVSADGHEGFVTFHALLFRNGDSSFTERSRFVRHKKRWLYMEAL